MPSPELDPRLRAELHRVRNRRIAQKNYKHRLQQIGVGALWFMGFAALFWGVLVGVAWVSHP